MDYAFLLSQEHPDLPRAEMEAVLHAEDVAFEVAEEHEGVVFLDAEEVRGIDRLAMTVEVAEPLYRFKPENYQKLAAKDVEAGGTFAVRAHRLDDTEAPEELERNIGRIIDRNSEAGVDLDDPEETFRVYLVDGLAYLCRLVEEVDRSAYEQRKNQFRPFSSPVTIHPRLARVLVNLSEVPRDGTVLDPFCGTGGILIEAGLVGCDLHGADIQSEMVEGTEENLDAMDLEAELHEAAFEDAAEAYGETFDAVVTDLPYGKASVVEGDPTEAFVETAPDLADRVVFMTDKSSVEGMEPEFEIYVHRSLTRYVYIMEGKE